MKNVFIVKKDEKMFNFDHQMALNTLIAGLNEHLTQQLGGSIIDPIPVSIIVFSEIALFWYSVMAARGNYVSCIAKCISYHFSHWTGDVKCDCS